MTEQLNDDRTAIPLIEAASALGITTDALRMRWKRGKIEGRRVFVYVTEQPNSRPNGDQSRPSQADSDQADIEVELNRVLRDNERLNQRLDDLLATHAKERDREQVLRQQMQNQIDRLGGQIALPAPDAPSPRIPAA